MARSRIQFDSRTLRANLRGFGGKLNAAVGDTMDDESDWATAYLRSHAPWADETGAARAGLMAMANRLGSGAHELLLSYSVHYGIYLETIESGRYAVIAPAMRIIGRQVLSDLTHIIDRMDR